MGSKRHCGKVDQLKLTNVGSEHASIVISVAISWGNTTHFGSYINMAGFPQTVTYINM